MTPPRAIAVALGMVWLGLAVALSGCGDTGTAGPALRGVTRDIVAEVGQVRLPDVAPGAGGRVSALRARPGGLLLVFFGFASCPDICPTTLGDLRRARSRLAPAQQQRVQVAMVTVDPRRDTAQVLNRYLSHFFPTWRAYRTTDPALLQAAEKPFGARHSIVRASDGGYEVTHSAYTYAVDDIGTVRVEWPFATSPRDIAHDLTTLLGMDGITTASRKETS